VCALGVLDSSEGDASLRSEWGSAFGVAWATGEAGSWLSTPKGVTGQQEGTDVNGVWSGLSPRLTRCRVGSLLPTPLTSVPLPMDGAAFSVILLSEWPTLFFSKRQSQRLSTKQRLSFYLPGVMLPRSYFFPIIISQRLSSTNRSLVSRRPLNSCSISARRIFNFRFADAC